MSNRLDIILDRPFVSENNYEKFSDCNPNPSYLFVSHIIQTVIQYAVKIESIESDLYKLNFPITIHIEKNKNEFIATIDKLGIYEYSDDIDDVIENVKQYLVYLYQELNMATNDQLTPQLQNQKIFISKLISPL